MIKIHFHRFGYGTQTANGYEPEGAVCGEEHAAMLSTVAESVTCDRCKRTGPYRDRVAVDRRFARRRKARGD